MISTPSTRPSRRDLLTTAAGSAAFGLASPLALAARGRNEVLRVGLVGCGGRGGGAAVNALNADPNTELVALGDAFEDQARKKLGELSQHAAVGAQVKVDEAHVFVGFDAYEQVIDACDVVLLATSPHFRPLHVAYAVEKGKHLFVEKPVATDAPGVRSIMASSELAAQKGLSLVSGLCYRYQFAKQEIVRRVHEGAVGDIRTLQCTYNTGELWHRGRKPEWSEMEVQMRNWLYHTWLSGDHIAEQHIHSLDKLAWAMQDVYPVKATSTGGRIKRTDPKYGDAYDHFNTVYEWEDGVVGFSSCRQMSGTTHDVSDHVYGSEGVAHLQRHSYERADGDRWRFRMPDDARWKLRRGEADDMYQNEHDALFWSIRAGEPLNNGEYMCKSTMMAIMARLSAYTGQAVTWEQAWNSTLDLTPPAYEWGDAPEPVVAIPGITKFS